MKLNLMAVVNKILRYTELAKESHTSTVAS